MWQTAGGRPHGAWMGVGDRGRVRGVASATPAHTRGTSTPLRTDLTDGRDAPHHDHHHRHLYNTTPPGPPSSACVGRVLERRPQWVRQPGPSGAAPPPQHHHRRCGALGFGPRLDVIVCKGVKVHLELQSVLMRYAFTI